MPCDVHFLLVVLLTVLLGIMVLLILTVWLITRQWFNLDLRSLKNTIRHNSR